MYVYRCPGCYAKVWLVVSITPVPLCDHDETDRMPMELLSDTATAVLALEERPQLCPLRVDHLHKVGITVPETQHALEWLYRHRAKNGWAGAFLMVGGRRCIDLVAFARIARERKA